jgi:LPXTG-motif cell wall-anchored protein
VGDCADAELPRDKGKWCSTLVSGDDASGTKVYAIGPVGEKPEKQITVSRQGSAQLTPGYQVGVADGNVGDPQQLTAEQLANNTFIIDNLLLDQAAGIGNGLADLPAGVPAAGGDTGGTGGTGGTGTPPIIVEPEVPPTGDPTYVPDGEIVVVNPNVDSCGEAVFAGSGCLPNEVLSVSLDGQSAGTITADSEGKFAGALGVPQGTAPGVHTITVRGAVCVLNADVTVQGALAFTGSSSHTTTYVLAGFAAVVVGLVLVVGARRRRRGVMGRSYPPPSSP